MGILFDAVTPDRARRMSKQLTKNWTPIGPEPPELPGNISPFITGFELQAHFAIGDTIRALDLMRRTWGWYLVHEAGTQSTMIEGYRTDGTFGYRAERGYQNDPSYVSHAHGWSTGATSALTNYIAGLQVTGPGGEAWAVRPQFGLLGWAEAGFMTPKGKLRTKWEKVGIGYNVWVESAIFTKGQVSLPTLKEQAAVVLVNGTRPPDLKESMSHLEFELPGGMWNITVRPLGGPAPR